MTPEERAQLRSNAQTGADLSPGDPIAAAALAHIEALEKRLLLSAEGMTDCNDPRHDCFAGAAASARAMEAAGEKVGWVIVVDGSGDEPVIHMRGNGSSLGLSLMEAVKSVVMAHKSTGCPDCDRAVLGLYAALQEYKLVTEAMGGVERC